MADNSPAAILQKAVMTALTQLRAPQTLDLSSPAAANPANARCLQTYTDARKAALSAKKMIGRRTETPKPRSAMPWPRSPALATSAISSPVRPTPRPLTQSTARTAPGFSTPPR
jgi:hypothetical protein